MDGIRSLVWLTLAGLGLFGGCGGSGGATSPGGSLSAARYALGWRQDGVEVAGGQLRFRSDQGYQIALTTGLLTSHSVQLVKCQSASPSASLLPPIFSSGVAMAGHSGAADPSTVATSLIEDLRALAEVPLGEVQFPQADYCQLHYLVARSNAQTQGLETHPEMRGMSLHLVGSWTHPDHPGRGSFDLSTPIAHGKLVDLPPLGAARGTRVTVVRELRSLFDGADLAHPHAPTLSRQVLGNLLEHTTVAAQGGEP